MMRMNDGGVSGGAGGRREEKRVNTMREWEREGMVRERERGRCCVAGGIDTVETKWGKRKRNTRFTVLGFWPLFSFNFIKDPFPSKNRNFFTWKKSGRKNCVHLTLVDLDYKWLGRPTPTNTSKSKYHNEFSRLYTSNIGIFIYETHLTCNCGTTKGN